MVYDIELLKRLQIVDKEIYDLCEEQEDIPRQIEILKENVGDQTKHVKEADEHLKEVKLSLNKKELALKEREENIKKYDAQLFQVKTNKEYTALQSEISNLKADNSVLEEEIIKMLDEVQNVENDLGEENKRFKKLEDECTQKTNELERKLKGNEEKLNKLKEKKEELAKTVDPIIFSTYERIIKGKSGVALAKVEDESCGMCQMKLLPQTINEILLGKKMVRCENCSRILYIENPQ